MASVVKILSGMTLAGFASGAGITYYGQNKINDLALNSAQKHAKNGKIPIGGMTKDGKLWDGEMTIDEFKKNLKKRALITSLLQGGLTAIGTAIIAGVALAFRGKMPKTVVETVERQLKV